MKKIVVMLVVLLVAFAVVMPAAAGGNGPGPGGNGTGPGGNGTGQPGTCLCGDPASTGNSYGPGQPGAGNGTPALNGNGYGYGPGQAGTPVMTGAVGNGTPFLNRSASQVAAQVTALKAAPLSAAESAGLQFMYEEQKMARDVYTAMNTRWKVPVFKNIAGSEQTHMSSIRTLLVRYGLPVPQTAAGVFNDVYLQSLYTQLVASGSQSLADAYQAGVSIEQQDIADLQIRLAQTTHADIKQVYTNLLNASSNHLASFTGLLGSLGG